VSERSWSEEPAAFAAVDGTQLRGTITRPPANPAPAALVLSGSGPLDRDSNMPGQRLDVGKALAEALAAHGVGSPRYDKRGVGESGGDYLTTGFEQETSDARALDALRRVPGIDAARVTVIGHSVGATIAIRLASDEQAPAAVVLLSGASRPGAVVMESQSERIAASMRGPSRLVKSWFLRRQERVRELLLSSSGDTVRVGRTELPARWFREYMAYDPASDLRSVRCPVLAITGRKDLQVDPGDVAHMSRLSEAPFTGETPDLLTHLLRSDTGPPGLSRYRAQLKAPVDADLLERVAVWTAARASTSA